MERSKEKVIIENGREIVEDYLKRFGEYIALMNRAFMMHK